MPQHAEVFQHHTRLLTAIRSIDGGRFHLSVSHRDRIPTWGELGFARDCLLPLDVWLMVPHPPREYWMNYCDRVLHLWEFRDATLIRSFKAEGTIASQLGYDKPTDGNGAPG